MDASLLWDRMVLMGRIQHSTHPTRSCMDNKTRTQALTGRVAPLDLWPAQEGWESTTTRFSGLMSMMDMVESDEDSGPPSVAEREPEPAMPLFLTPCHMTLCCSSLVHYSISIYSFSFMLMTVSRPRLLFFPVPSFATHGLSISTYAYYRYEVETIDRHSLFPPFPSCFSLSFFLPPLPALHLIRVTLPISSSSRCSLPLATARHCTYSIPLAPTAVKYYIFNRRQCYPPPHQQF